MEFALNFPVNVKNLPKTGLRLTFIASAEECEKLAKNHAVLKIEEFSATYSVLRENADIIKVQGQFIAHIIQNCVSSGKRVAQTLCEKIEARFIKTKIRTSVKQQDQAVDLQINNENETEFFENYSGDFIELGHITEELFELSIDHYPHSGDAEPIVFSAPADIDRGEVNEYSPFAILKQYQNKKGA